MAMAWEDVQELLEQHKSEHGIQREAEKADGHIGPEKGRLH